MTQMFAVIAVVKSIRLDRQKVVKASERASKRNLGRASAAIRLTAKRSIRRRDKPSRVGSPPNTRRGDLKKAILFKVENPYNAVIGPDVSVVGESGAAHERGGKYKGHTFDRRPFMQPALDKMIESGRVPKFWRATIS